MMHDALGKCANGTGFAWLASLLGHAEKEERGTITILHTGTVSLQICLSFDSLSGAAFRSQECCRAVQ